MSGSKLSASQQFHSIWKLGGLTPWQLTKKVIYEIGDDDLLGRASELAYNFLFAVFPLMLFLLALFGLFASHGVMLRSRLLLYFADMLPPMAYNVFNKTVNELATTAGGGKLTFGIVVALLFASGGMSSMISTLNVAYHVREARSLIKVRAIALALTIAISVCLTLALVVVLIGNHLADMIGAALHLSMLFVVGWKMLQWPIALFFVVVSFSLVYYFGPDLRERHWYWVTPGSLFGVLLWLAASAGFRAYLHFFNTYTRTYGSLGAVIVLLMWFYVTGLAFLIGGEINAAIEHAAALRGHPEAKAPGQKAA
ncbi:MAG: YihY/virulence factor BrkB family protein [Terriglobales bacterium]